MKTQSIVVAVLAAALLGAAAYGAYRLGMGHGMRMAAPATHGAPDVSDGGKQEKKILYWYDPMFPQQKFDKPGKSPFMDMMLVPKYADDAPGAGVQIDPGLRQGVGMRFARVGREKLAAQGFTYDSVGRAVVRG